MHILPIVLLFFSVIIGGGIPYLWKTSESSFKYVLTFSASYLLCVTLVHLFPELFDEAVENDISTIVIGGLLLVGFLFQKVLEYFSGGIEHGHIHQHTKIIPQVLLLALCLHGVLEGAVLAGDSNHYHHTNHLLFGIVLHKMPAAFALSSILLYEKFTIKKSLIFLFIFSLASPLGLVLSEFLLGQIEEKYTVYLFAIVTGNLLHIATTIFFESSPHHRLQRSKWIATVVGVFLALVVEYLG